jgi:hypothetical protein
MDSFTFQAVQATRMGPRDAPIATHAHAQGARPIAPRIPHRPGGGVFIPRAGGKHVFRDIADDPAPTRPDERQTSTSEPLVSLDSGPAPTASSVFTDLLRRAGAGASGASGLRLDTSRNTQGRGVFIDRDVVKGSVLLELPLDMCISVDYGSGGLRLPRDVPPSGPAWPRLTKAISKDDTLPWDVLISLALLDSLSGMGSEGIQDWGNTALPAPRDMSLPLCLPPSMLDQLQDEDLARKAMEQKQRLRELFPGLAVPMDGDDGPTWMEYAFGCVRSRAFSLGEDRYAFVPVMDAANHAMDPNADFSFNPGNDTIVLFAMENIKAGDEVTISYTGRVGYTNKRLMTQYGFVFTSGNPFDTYSLPDDLDVDDSSTLALDAVQKALGDGDFMVEAFSGKDPYSYACLKSLPMEAGEEAGEASDNVGRVGSSVFTADQRAMLESIQRAITGRVNAWQSSLRDDESMLGHLLSGSCDSRLVAVMRYRVQTKKRDVAMLELIERLLQA